MSRAACGLLAAMLLVLTTMQPALSDQSFTLSKIQDRVRQDYSAVKHLATKALIDQLAADKDVLLFDVREKDEFAVSHLEGAKRVDPGTWRWTFLNSHGKAAAGKIVVFYCSVGVRSSRLAAAVQSGLMKAGAKAVYNLDGGIFAWHNQKRPLMSTTGPTDFVHPFDAKWGRLVLRQDLARTKPAAANR